MLGGMVPRREFRWRFRYVSPNTLPIQVGIVPTSLLDASDNVFIYEDGVVPERTHIDEGIVPVKRLLSMYRFRTFGSVIAISMGPVRKFLFRYKVFRAVRKSIVSGIGPVKLLNARLRPVSPVRLPRLVGRDPRRLLPYNPKDLRDIRPFRLDGMVPVKRFMSKMIDCTRLKEAIELGIEPVSWLL